MSAIKQRRCSSEAEHSVVSRKVGISKFLTVANLLENIVNRYPFTARSITDPSGEKGGLGFASFETASRHCDVMNELIESYPGSPWNTRYWKSKPGEWKVNDNKISNGTHAGECTAL